MDRLSQLIREIHRRSLWQVLGIYVVGAWVGYEVIQSLTEGMGLPSWFPALAVVLFIIGLPIVLATAFVQEGVGHRAPDPAELETTSGGTPIPPDTSAADSTPRRLFTWKNSIIGGLVAFALWGVVATVWLLIGGPSDAPSATAAAGNDETVESIAVLAFEDMSPKGDQEYFSDGISEEILNALAKIDGLRVSGRSSSFQFKDTNTGIQEIGKQLGVETVLEGSVRKHEGDIRITAQLVNSEDGFHLWSETYDRELADVFAVQEEIANEIVAALGFAPAGEGVTAGRADAQRIAAHDAYLLGLQRWSQRADEGDLRAALRYFEIAVEADSLYAPAHAAKALVYSVLPQYSSFAVDEAISLTKANAERALALDSTLAEPYAAMCQSGTWYDWDWAAAEANCRRAIELRPSYANAHQWLGELLGFTGRWNEALPESYEAERLDPLAAINVNQPSFALYALGDYEAAVDHTRRALQLAPGAWWAEWVQFMSHFATRNEDSLEESFLLWAETAEDSLVHSEFVELFLAAEEDDEKRREAVGLVPRLNLSHLRLTPAFYVMLDEHDLAIRELEQMYAERSWALVVLVNLPNFGPLHTDPRFQAIHRGMGFDQSRAAD